MDGGEHHGGLTSSESPPPLPPWVPAPPCRAVKAGLDGAGGRAKGGGDEGRYNEPPSSGAGSGCYFVDT